MFTWLRSKIKKKELIFTLVFLALIVILAVIPTGFARQIYVHSEGAKARVLEVDNSGISFNGIIQVGDQGCIVEIQTGAHKGETTKANNLLNGKLDIDKIFKPGDTAWVIVENNQDGSIVFVNMVDHFRIGKEFLLIGLFAVLIITFSGFTGIRTLLSFSFALMAIWKVLIPLTLKGYPPMLVALGVGCVIIIGTLIMVAGLTKKAYAAIGGAIACSLVTCLLAIVFTKYFGIHGAVLQWSESLLYSGYQDLDLTQIFMAAVYLACSGAILDLAIDISAALDELVVHKPDITMRELVRSGLTIGKSVVGSQTTTLLLAYMGSYLSVMMVYMAQATPMMSIFNSKTIAAEVLHTFVGCIGLVLVSPATSLISAFLYTVRKRTKRTAEQPIVEDDLSVIPD
ncbi:MAG: YibE/F family protein [Dehalococcoidales bacterium]|nr:YibE/F family protein [Dehalococcoidales bacterium]